MKIGIVRTTMKQDEKQKKACLTFTELVASLSATAIFISEGMHRGWSAPAVPKLRSKDSLLKLDPDDVIWLEAIYFLGELVSIPVAICLLDKIGRKNCILVNGVLGLIAWPIIALTHQVSVLYFARFLAGFTGNISMVAVPIYIAEIANPKVRGLFLGIVSFVQIFGILLIYCLVPYLPVYVPSVVAEVLLVCQIGVFSFMPESPYYLVLKEKRFSAKVSLDKLRNKNGTYEELEQIEKRVDEYDKNETQLQKLVVVTTDKSNRKGLTVAILLYAGLQFGGFSATLMNVDEVLIRAQSIFLQSSIAEIIFAILLLMGSFLCLLSLRIFGKKHLLVISSVTSGIFLLGLAIYFNLKHMNVNLVSVGWVATVCITLYAICFSLGSGSLIEPMVAELFPTRTRALGTTFTNAIDAIFGMLSIVLYGVMVQYFGMHSAYYLFAMVSFCNAAFVGCFLPETEGKSLQEIQDVLGT